MVIQTFISPLTEPPTQFIIPLNEATCQEGEDVTFTCEVTDEKIPARWFKDSEKLQPSDKHVMKKDGRVHTLTIKDAQLEDRAEYTIELKDRKSSAPLFVEGNLKLYGKNRNIIVSHKKLKYNSLKKKKKI